MTYSEIQQVWKARMKQLKTNCYQVSIAMGHTASFFGMAMHARNDMHLHNICLANEVLSLSLYIDGKPVKTAQEALEWLWEAHKVKSKSKHHSKSNQNQIWRWNHGKSAARYNGFRNVIHDLGSSLEVRPA